MLSTLLVRFISTVVWGDFLQRAAISRNFFLSSWQPWSMGPKVTTFARHTEAPCRRSYIAVPRRSAEKPAHRDIAKALFGSFTRKSKGSILRRHVSAFGEVSRGRGLRTANSKQFALSSQQDLLGAESTTPTGQPVQTPKPSTYEKNSSLWCTLSPTHDVANESKCLL